MFKPYNKFNYNDKWLLKIHESKLFPESEILREFSTKMDDLNTDVVAIAYLISQDGFINGLDQVLTPKYDHAFEHLVFLSSLTAKDYLAGKTPYGGEELDNLIIFILTYVVNSWFEVKKIECLFPFTPRLLGPLKIVKKDAIQELFVSENTKFLVENYITNLNIDLTRCKSLANKICLFGYSAAMLAHLDPHPNLNYKAVMDILNYYVEKRDITKISKVLGIYFPEKSIVDAFKNA